MILDKTKSLYRHFTFFLRKKPDFFITGFQKCGTTSLYNYIMSLPEYKPGLVKEQNELSYSNYSIIKFLSNFPITFSKTGNASHQMTFVPYTLERVKNLFPDAKYLVIMRNPIHRAFSQYQHNKKNNRDSGEFMQRIFEEINILNKLNDIHDINEIFRLTSSFGAPKKNDHYGGMYISKGIYYSYIKKIVDLELDYLPICLEHLSSDFPFEFSRIANFLGSDYDGSYIGETKKFNKGDYISHIPKEAYDILNEFYKPFNQKLYNLLGEDYNW